MTAEQWSLTNGWLNAARHIASPNANPRPQGAAIELVVIHNISLPPGEFGGSFIEALFTNQLDHTAHPYFEEIAHLEVSTHFLIRRTGELLQFVSTDERAWHAGVSDWCGRQNCNDFSIGIELEGTDEIAYTDSQYDQLAALIAFLRGAYPNIAADAMVGHCDIAPERKTDPGEAFDWARLKHALATR